MSATMQTHKIGTVDGQKTIVSTGCDCCGEVNVRIAEDGIAYERNAQKTYVRHNCDPRV